jgi:hypothetical protein
MISRPLYKIGIATVTTGGNLHFNGLLYECAEIKKMKWFESVMEGRLEFFTLYDPSNLTNIKILDIQSVGIATAVQSFRETEQSQNQEDYPIYHVRTAPYTAVKEKRGNLKKRRSSNES